MNKIKLIIFLFLFICTSAYAEWIVLDYLVRENTEHYFDNADWHQYLKTSDAEYYYDSKSLKYKNNKVVVAVKVNYNSAQEEFYRVKQKVRTARHIKGGGNDNLSKSVLKYKHIDCGANKISYLGMIFWSESNLKGHETLRIYDQTKYQPIKEIKEPMPNKVGYLAPFENMFEQQYDGKLAKAVCKK